MLKKILTFFGAAQVQYTQSMQYISIASNVMLALTFWATAGLAMIGHWFPWMGAKEFLGCAAIGLISVMLFDKFILYKYRQDYLNRRAWDAKNPAKDAITQIIEDVSVLKKDIEKIKQALGVKDNAD